MATREITLVLTKDSLVLKLNKTKLYIFSEVKRGEDE